MKLVYAVLILSVALAGCVSTQDSHESVQFSAEQRCINSGGTVTAYACCMSSGDFPNTCLIGACGCSPENSHEVAACDCGENKCWDGNACTG